MKKQITNISLSSIFASLSVVFILLGSILDVLDLTVAAICTLINYISIYEVKGRYPMLIYFATSALSLIICPISTSVLYYIFFFGYYPILKVKLRKKGKITAKVICIIIFNIVFTILMVIFKKIFAMQNEPYYMYIILLVVYNIFFICFDRCIDILLFVYFKKIRPKLTIGRN